MSATSNAARRDASAAKVATLFSPEPLVYRAVVPPQDDTYLGGDRGERVPRRCRRTHDPGENRLERWDMVA